MEELQRLQQLYKLKIKTSASFLNQYLHCLQLDPNPSANLNKMKQKRKECVLKSICLCQLEFYF